MRRLSTRATKYALSRRPYRRLYSVQHRENDIEDAPPAPSDPTRLEGLSESFSRSSQLSQDARLNTEDGTTPTTSNTTPTTPITPTDLTRLLALSSHPTNGSTALITKLLSLHPNPTTATYHAALRALAVHPSPFMLSTILSQMSQNWIPLTPTAHHDIAVSLCRNNQLEETLEYVTSMEDEGIQVKGWLYDMLLHSLLQHNELEEALRLLHHRIRTGAGGTIEVNTWYALLDAACARLHHASMKFIWARQIHGANPVVKPSDGHCLAVLRSAARNADMELAEKVIALLNDRGVVLSVPHYEALLDSHTASILSLGRPEAKSENARTSIRVLEKAVRILGAMGTAGLHVTRASTRGLLRCLIQDDRRIDVVYRSLQALRKTTEIPVAVVDTLIESCVHFASGSAVVDAKVSGERLERAVSLYKGLSGLCKAGPSIHTFNILLGGCAVVGSTEGTAMFLASEMVALGVRPNAVTYDRLISVCLRGGKGTESGSVGSSVIEGALHKEKDGKEDEEKYAYEDAFRYLKEMEGKSWVPRAETLREMIEACTKAGDERAWALLGKMREAGYDTGEVRAWLEEKWEPM